MSFGSPGFFAALVVLPLLVVWYLDAQKRRRRAAAAFSSAAMAASVTPHRPGWRRHVPMGALLLALGLLVVALAKPQHSVAVNADKASILLATDVSGSMLATDIKPNRLTAARRAGQAFVAKVPKRVNVGVMEFNQVPTVLQSPTTDRDDIALAFDHLRASGTTATGEAINTALRALGATTAQELGPNTTRPPAAIVLLSDGVSKRGVDPVKAAQQAGKLKVPIYTVALGTPAGVITIKKPKGQTGTTTTRVPPDPQSLAQIAKASGGEAFEAKDTAKLSAVYQKLGTQLGKKHVNREISADFAGGGLVLLLLGALMSLGWLGRLI